MPAQQPKRRKAFARRSRTGCRTCRIRHVKCDETPGQCRNCRSSGWRCELYELNRPPRRSDLPLQPLATGFHWAMTADERRCVAFFLSRTVESLTSFYDSSLWCQLVLQMSCTEPAVYHAVVALSAVNQDLERHGIPMPGTSARSPWHRFALEQSMRSFGLLNKRHIVQDPQLREVLLVCCLLFIVLELAKGNFDNATMHLQSGLAILKEMGVQRRMLAAARGPVEDELLEAFLQLESQAAQQGVLQPLLHFDSQIVHELHYGEYLYEFRDLRGLQQALVPLVNTGFPFLKRCWGRWPADLMAEYGVLHAKQQRLLSCLYQFGAHLARFRKSAYDRLSAKDQRGADMVKLMHLTLLLSIKTALQAGGGPGSMDFIEDYEELFSRALAVIARFDRRPLMTIDAAVCPALFMVAARCPDYGLRLQAVDFLRSWAHCEGFFHSPLIADLAVEGMKRELRYVRETVYTTDRPPPAGLSFETRDQGEILVRMRDRTSKGDRVLSLEPNERLAATLSSIPSARYWPCVREFGIQPHPTSSDNNSASEDKSLLSAYHVEFNQQDDSSPAPAKGCCHPRLDGDAGEDEQP